MVPPRLPDHRQPQGTGAALSLRFSDGDGGLRFSYSIVVAAGLAISTHESDLSLVGRAVLWPASISADCSAGLIWL
jgi:hypothetical protein